MVADKPEATISKDNHRELQNNLNFHKKPLNLNEKGSSAMDISGLIVGAAENCDQMSHKFRRMTTNPPDPSSNLGKQIYYD